MDLCKPQLVRLELNYDYLRECDYDTYQRYYSDVAKGWRMRL